MKNPFAIVRAFEERVAEYTGAPYAVAVDSCTNAIFLCCKYLDVRHVTIPKRTYLSVPMSVIHAGAAVAFTDKDWRGTYRLEPYPIVDAAKRFTSGMYQENTYMCLSFHTKKIVNIGKGGMILLSDSAAVEWLKKARYEGRSEKFYTEDNIQMLGWNMYMTPDQAARGLMIMQSIPQHNEDQYEVYKDLTTNDIFNENKSGKVQ